MSTVLFTCATEKERDRFLALLDDLACNADLKKADTTLITKLLSAVQLDPLITTTENAVLFVGGQKMASGTMMEMNRRFVQEVNAHNGSVEIKALRGGIWKTVRSRMRQRV